MSDAAYQQSICVTYICCIYKHYYRKFRDITLTGKDKKAEIIYLKVNKIFEVVPLGKFFFPEDLIISTPVLDMYQTQKQRQQLLKVMEC